jgi:ferritin-like metal-binding protein YciE
MGIFTPDVNNLRELYINMLQHALSSEKQIVEKGLPAMIEKSTNPDLARAFRDHLTESKQHVVRLERILDATQGEINDARCKVTAQLISSAESEIGDAANDQIRDVILIAAGNQVEHHEIAVYGTLRTWAEILGNQQDAQLLDKTLAEEEKADQLLTQLSQQINVAAPVA